MGIDNIHILKDQTFDRTSVRQEKHALEEALRSEHIQGRHAEPAKPLVNCPLCRTERIGNGTP